MKRPRRLRWKLTVSYVLVTLSALLALELVSVVVLFVFINPLRETRIPKPELHLIGLAIASTLQVTPSGSVDTSALVRRLLGDTTAGGLAVFVIDPSGQQRLALPSGATLPNDPDLLNAALAGQADSSRMYSILPDNRLLHGIPLFAADGHVSGALMVVTTPEMFAPRLLLLTIVVAGLSLVLFAAIAALIGAIFGSLTAAGFSRRFEALSEAATAWGGGDFTARTDDPIADELGQLSSRFNTMASQLQRFMDTKQALATVEERNRLARDLHDSVKQQIFAISMQVAAASTKLNTDPAVAQQHLNEVKTLIQNAQHELSGIIHELRPPSLVGNGLTTALRDYAANWSRQQDIRVELQLADTEFSLLTEEAFIRVAQEALSNVARHSGANQVMVRLSQAGVLTIQDNGAGFDPAIIREGIGFQSMRERLSAIHGTLTISSTPSHGTMVEAALCKDGSP